MRISESEILSRRRADTPRLACVFYITRIRQRDFHPLGRAGSKKSTQQNFDTPFHAGDVVPDLKSREISPQKSIKNCFTGKSSKIIKKKKFDEEAK